MSYLYSRDSDELKRNLMEGRPTRMRYANIYSGLSIPVCGEYDGSPVTVPWPVPQANSNREYQLHDEIISFYNYMKPTARELQQRSSLMQRLSSKLSPDFDVKPVGSYVTGLYLPTSDIDVIAIPAISQTSSNRLYSYRDVTNNRVDAESGVLDLSWRLRTSVPTPRYYYHGRRRSSSASTTKTKPGFTIVETITRASVPLLRIKDDAAGTSSTGIQVDLTFERTHSLAATTAVQNWESRLATRHGCISINNSDNNNSNNNDVGLFCPLLFVLKQFLSMRRLGTTFTGGINSYVLVWLLVSWFEIEHPKNRTHNLGTLLMDVLRFYGSQFDYTTQCIRIRPYPRYERKPLVTTAYKYWRSEDALCIFDPAGQDVEMGGKVYAIMHVRATMQSGYETLKAWHRGREKVPKLGVLGQVLGGNYSELVGARR